MIGVNRCAVSAEWNVLAPSNLGRCRGTNVSDQVSEQSDRSNTIEIDRQAGAVGYCNGGCRCVCKNGIWTKKIAISFDYLADCVDWDVVKYETAFNVES